MALSYRDVKDMYDDLHESGAVSAPIEQWSSSMNDQTGSDMFSEGLHSNFIKNASVGLDKLLEATGLPAFTKSVGGAIGTVVGNKTAGENIGEGTPRMLANFAPMLIPGVGEAGALAGVARFAGVAGLSGSETYTKTGSPAAGLISGVTNAAMPGVADFAEQNVLKRLGGRLVEGPISDATGNVVANPSRYFSETAGQKLASFGTGQAVGAGLNELSGYGQDIATGQPLHNPFTSENFLNLTLGQLPFALMHGAKTLVEGRVDHANALQSMIDDSQKLIEQKQASETLQQVAPVDRIQPQLGPYDELQSKAIDNLDELIAQSRQKEAKIQTDPTVDPVQKVNAINAELDTQNELATQREGEPVWSKTVFGNDLSDATSRTPLIAQEKTQYGKSRDILVADDPRNPEQFRGIALNYSTFGEPEPQESDLPGHNLYSVPDGWWTQQRLTPEGPGEYTPKWLQDEQRQPGTTEPIQPELPQQTTPSADPFGHLVDVSPQDIPAALNHHFDELRQAETEVQTAQTPQQAQVAVLRANAVADRVGLNRITDDSIRASVMELVAPKEDPLGLVKYTAKVKPEEAVQAATLGKVREMKRALIEIATQRREELNALREDYRADKLVESHYTHVREGDESDLQPQLSKLEDLRNHVAGMTGKRADATLPQINKLYSKWVNGQLEGQKGPKDGNFAKLRDTVLRMAKYGKGLESGRGEAKQVGEEATGTGITHNGQALSEEVANLRESTDSSPLQDRIDELINGSVKAKTESIKEFRNWFKTQPEGKGLDYPDMIRESSSRFEDEVQRYFVFRRLRNDGVLKDKPELSLEEQHHFAEALTKRGVEVDDPTSLKDFPSRSHVSYWDDQVTQALDKGVQQGQKPNHFAPQVEPFEPGSKSDAQQFEKLHGKTGSEVVESLIHTKDPIFASLAQDLKQFPELLSRITTQVVKGDLSQAHLGENNKTSLYLSHGLLTASDYARNFTVAHELLHGMTMSTLDDPKNFDMVQQLETMRARLIGSLSKMDRQYFNQAVESDWMGRYARGEATLGELHPYSDKALILYGLLNKYEFTAQGFTEKPFRDFMQKVPSREGGSIWNKFVGWVKKLNNLGEYAKGTAFEDFLNKSSALLQRGEWVAGFTNFAERYLEKKGVGTQSQVERQAQRALSIVQESEHGLTPNLILKQLHDTQDLVSSSLVEATRALTAMSPEDGETFDSILKEAGEKSGPLGLDQVLHDFMVGDRNDLKDITDLMPDEANRYLSAKVHDFQQVLDTVRAGLANKQEGLLNLADTSQLTPALRQALEAVSKAQQVLGANQDSVVRLQALSSVTPEGYFGQNVLAAAPAPRFLRETLDNAGDTAKSVGSWLKRFLEPIGQLARSNPEMAEGLSRGWELQANRSQMARESLRPLGLDLHGDATELSAKGVKQQALVLSDKQVSGAVNKWIFENQKNGKKTGATVVLSSTEPQIQKILSGLSDKQKSDVTDLVAKQSASMQMHQQQMSEKMWQEAATRGTMILAGETGKSMSDTLPVVDLMMQGIRDSQDPNPQIALEAQQKVAIARTHLTPQTALDLYKYASTEVAKITQWNQYYAANPAWATGERLSRYRVESRSPAGRSLNLQADSLSEARSMTSGHTEVNITDQWARTDDDSPLQLGVDAPALLDKMSQYEASQREILSKYMTPEQLQMMEATSPSSQIAREAANEQGLPGLNPPSRGLTRGAEQLPWFQNHLAYVQRSSSYWSRRLFRAQIDAHLAETMYQQRPDLASGLKQHAENMLSRDPRMIANLNRFTSVWMMGFQAASTIVQATEPFLSHVSELTAINGGRPVDSYKRVLRALQEVGGAKVGSRGYWSDEHNWLIDQAQKSGELDSKLYDDEAYGKESVAQSFQRVLQGNKPQTLGQRLGSAWGSYSNAAMWMFKQVHNVTQQSALLSSFDLYRSQGLSKENAFKKAAEFNHAVSFGGGKAQRPIGLFSGQGAFPRGAAMLATSLQSYMLGTTWQIIRYLKNGLFRPEGTTPAERYAARVAGVQMLATQFAAAGALGMPFVAGAISLLNKAFPDLEVTKKFYTTIPKMLGEDGENGGLLSDIATRGVPSMLGWDMQSRLSLGNTLPGVSEINGFQPQNLLGPPANLVANFVKGAGKLATGDVPGAAQQFAPNALKKILALVGNSGQVKDFAGRQVFSPTPGESLGMALGFQPTRLTETNTAGQILKQGQDVQNHQEQQFHQQMAQEVLKGNFGSVRQALLARAQQDPAYNAKAGVQHIAKLAEEASFPRDLRREGNLQTSQSNTATLNSLGIPLQNSSETSRFNFRQGVSTKLGLPQASPVEEAMAQTMDQFAVKNPDATRAGLRGLAEQSLLGRRASQSDFLQGPSPLTLP